MILSTHQSDAELEHIVHVDGQTGHEQTDAEIAAHICHDETQDSFRCENLLPRNNLNIPIRSILTVFILNLQKLHRERINCENWQFSLWLCRRTLWSCRSHSVAPRPRCTFGVRASRTRWPPRWDTRLGLGLRWKRKSTASLRITDSHTNSRLQPKQPPTSWNNQ